MMKAERMGLIALAGLLMVLLICNAAARCSCSHASSGDISAPPATVAPDVVYDTIDSTVKPGYRSTHKSKRKNKNKTGVRPFQRQHRDEQAR